MITVTVSNMIYLRGVTTPLRAEITKRLTIDNPEYVKRKKRRAPVWGVPPKIKLYYEDGTMLVLPRGFRVQLEDILNKENVTWGDHTIYGNSIDFGKWNEEGYAIRTAQRPCLDAVSVGNGVLVAPAGSGKTVMGLRYLWEKSRPALWITHTIDLLEQTTKRAYQCMPDIKEVGRIAEGKTVWGSGQLIVATYQTLMNNEALIEKLNGFIDTVIVDECLTGDTLITMRDGTLKPIDTIKNGDEVVGGKVSDFFSREGIVYKVRTRTGVLKCTETHTHIAILKEKTAVGEYRTCDLRKGDMLLTPAITPHTVSNDFSMDKLQFVALILTDGHIEKYRCKVAVRRDMEYYRHVFQKGLNAFGVSDTYKESINCRGDLTVWSTSQSLIKELTTVFKIPMGKKSTILDIPDCIFTAPLDSIKGFVETVFSVEGTVSNQKNHLSIVLDMTSNTFISKLQILLTKFGVFTARLSRSRSRRNPKHSDMYRLTISGEQAFSFLNAVGGLKNIRKQMVSNGVKYSQISTPTVISYNNKLYFCTPIHEIQDTGKTEKVYDFTTTTHTFIANNILTHNCHRTASECFSTVVNKLKAVERLGLTATPDRKDGLEEMVYATIGPQLYVIERNDLYDAGRLVKPTINPVYTTFNYNPASIVSEYGAIDAGGEEMVYNDLLQAVINDEERLQLIADNIADCVGYQLVISDSIPYCHKLYDNIVSELINRDIHRETNIKIVHGTLQRTKWLTARSESDAMAQIQEGKAINAKYDAKARRWKVQVEQYDAQTFKDWSISTAERKQIMKDAADRKIDILIATSQLVQEGLDLPHLNHGHLVTPKRGDEGGKSNGIPIEQAIGRVMRPDPLNKDKQAFWWDYVDYNVGIFKNQFYSRKKVYERLGLELPKKRQNKKQELSDFLKNLSY